MTRRTAAFLPLFFLLGAQRFYQLPQLMKADAVQPANHLPKSLQCPGPISIFRPAELQQVCVQGGFQAARIPCSDSAGARMVPVVLPATSFPWEAPAVAQRQTGVCE